MPAPAPASAPPTATPRLAWADLAKGLCILLVVLHHVTSKHYLGLLPADLGWVGQAWLGVNEALKPVRMPLFFAISGLFAASAMRRPWRSMARRVTGPYYLYVVWLLVLALVFTVERTLPMNRTLDGRELVLDLLWASTGVWFLYALAVYTAVARFTARLPAAWVIGAAALLSAATSWLPLDEVNRVSVLAHLVHFLLGARAPELVRFVGGVRRRGLLPRLTLVLLVLTAAVGVAGLPRSVDLLLLSAVGLPWGVRVAVGLVRRPRTAAALTWLGRRTLPVYVLHMPVLAALHHAPVDLLPPEGPGAPVLAVLYPLLATAGIVLACLALHAAALRVGLRPLFELPRPAGTVLPVRVPGLTEREPARA